MSPSWGSTSKRAKGRGGPQRTGDGGRDRFRGVGVRARPRRIREDPSLPQGFPLAASAEYRLAVLPPAGCLRRRGAGAGKPEPTSGLEKLTDGRLGFSARWARPGRYLGQSALGGVDLADQARLRTRSTRTARRRDLGRAQRAGPRRGRWARPGSAPNAPFPPISCSPTDV